MGRPRKAVPVEPAIDRSHIVEDVGRAGEIVGIEGRRGAFRILREAMTPKTETDWVELLGPITKGDGQFCAVRPDRIMKRRQPRGSRSRSSD